MISIIKKTKQYLCDCGLFRFIPDEQFVKMEYKKKLRKKLNYNNPKTFNEKLQWLKINNRKDIYTTMVDKYEVKQYVSNIIGKKHIIPTIGVYDSFSDIDFNKMPMQFVMKCTHDSGGLLIVKDKSKLDIKKARIRFNMILKRNYYYRGREWPYKNVKPRIIIEKFISNKDGSEIKDYKFFVFNGKVKCFKIDFNRFERHQANYYNREGKLLKFGEEICPPDFNKKLEIPDNLNKMIELAEKLSNNLPFVRIDFYSIDGEIYFGEITFYPASGFGRFIPEEWDLKLGNWLKLDSFIEASK